MIRRRTKQTVSLEQRIAEHAQEIRIKADAMSPGPERDALLERVRQAETASHMTEWVSSPRLRSPSEVEPPTDT